MSAELPSASAVHAADADKLRMDALELVAALRALRESGPGPAWWERFALCLLCLCRAKAILIARRTADRAAWTPLAARHADTDILATAGAALLGELGDKALARGFATQPRPEGAIIAAVRVIEADATLDTLALLEIPARERAAINELVLRAQLVADLAAGSQRAALAPSATPAQGAEDMFAILDLIARVMQEKHFGSAALALVNGIAAHFGCDQVVLGWEEGGYMRVRAISHLDRFEQRTENVQLLEAALEEAVDQRSNLSFPPAEGSTAVVLGHARVAQVLGYRFLTTELVAQGDAAAEVALLLADRSAPFEPARLHTLAVGMHLVLPWLAERQSRDKGVGERLWAQVRAAAARFVGLEQVGQKLIGILFGLALLYSLIGTAAHRIEADAELVTDSTQRLTAPFDGYIDEVRVGLGDEVREGALLATLDVQEMSLQESEVRADMRRYEAEADRARAAGQLADVEIALARFEQSRARLERITLYLQQSRIVAPFDAVVVEGERKDLAGMPVRQGDGMFRLARIEGLYASIRVPERDIKYVSAGAVGELRLLAQPEHIVPFTVLTVVPLAQVQGQRGNQFMVKVRVGEAPAAWWRPGMSGVAKVEAGERQIAWLLTHRVLDFLRMKLWW